MPLDRAGLTLAVVGSFIGATTAVFEEYAADTGAQWTGASSRPFGFSLRTLSPPYVLHPVPHDFNVQVCLIKTPWLVIHPSGVSGCFVQDTLPSTQYHNDTEVTNVKVREASHVRASFHKTIRFQFHTCHMTPLKSDAHVRNLSLIEHGLITARFASIYRIADGL